MSNLRRQFTAMAAFALAVTAVSANASSVNTTARFSQLTMGGFWSGANTYANGLKVNGQAINVCGGDPDCTGAMNNPASITADLEQESGVDFGYNTAFRQNAFSFASKSATVSGTGPSNTFTLGTFTFTNGGFYPLAFIDFSLTTQSSDPTLNNQTFNGRIRLDTNSGDETDAFAEADYFTVQSMAGSTFTSLGSVRVFDYGLCPKDDPSSPACNTGSVDLIGYIDSLHVDSFSNPTGGAFLNSSTTSALAPVPAPETCALMLTGLGLLGFFVRRRSSVTVVSMVSGWVMVNHRAAA